MTYPILRKKILNEHLAKRLDEKLKQLNSFRPLPTPQVKKLQDQFRIEMTYNSNGIEGNSLTLKETFLVITEGMTINGKPLKDHLEATNHYEALEYLSDLVAEGKSRTISEVLVFNLHRMIVQNIDKEWGGRYRTGEVMIGGADHFPPSATSVPHEMQHFIQWIRDNKTKRHPVELAALIHHYFVFVHPFFDGNGRTARLLMNVWLLQNGYPLVAVLKNDRKKYYRALAFADRGDAEPFVRFMALCAERSLDLYLKAVSPQQKNKDAFLPLSQIAPHTSFSTKYLNLLIRQGKLEGYKQKRNWLTSRQAVQRYLEARKRKR